LVYYGLDGYWTEPYNGDRYFTYSWVERLSYTVTLKDGSTFRGSGDSFTHDGETYKIGAKDGQNGITLWEPENIYTGQIVVGSLTAPVEVAAYGSPITQISIEPITLKPYENGYMVTETTDGETVEYFYYRTWNLDLQYTVTFRDGTVVTDTNCNVFFDGSDHSIDISDPQNAKNIWLPGNTYTVTNKNGISELYAD
jgi:archaellum component FlaF (FlaF/FlaG flagellin family)